MDFDQLATFVYVAKLKSFSRAGQKVFRSQSAVSAQIRQLEQAYRAKLLDRSAKSVELTPAGEVLFEYAERLAAAARRIHSGRGGSRQRGAGHGDVRRQRSHLPVSASGYFRGISAALSAGAHQHLPQFQPQNSAAHRRWHHRCRHRDLADQGAEHQGAPHLSRPPALHGQHAQSAGATGRKSRWKKWPRSR